MPFLACCSFSRTISCVCTALFAPFPKKSPGLVVQIAHMAKVIVGSGHRSAGSSFYVVKNRRSDMIEEVKQIYTPPSLYQEAAIGLRPVRVVGPWYRVAVPVPSGLPQGPTGPTETLRHTRQINFRAKHFYILAASKGVHGKVHRRR